MSRSIAIFIVVAGCRTAPYEPPPAHDLAAPPISALDGGPCGQWICDGADALGCSDDSATNACGECGPLPVEECNERDDDCDGLIDEDCPHLIYLPGWDVGRVRISGERLALELSSPTGVGIGSASLPSPSPIPTWASGGRCAAIAGELVAGDYDRWWQADSVWAFDLARGVVLKPSPTPSPAPLPSGGSRPRELAVDARRVAFTDGRAIFVWHIDNQTVAQSSFPADEDRDFAPDLSRDWLVFARGESFDAASEIVARDLVNGEEIVLSDGLGDRNRTPAIDGTHVVFSHATRADAGDAVVYAYDLITRSRALLSSEAPALRPRISGSLVCWDDRIENAGRGVTVHDLASGRQKLAAAQGFNCDLDGRRLVWSRIAYHANGYWRELLPDEP